MAEFVNSIDYSSRDYTSIRNDLINSIQYFAPQWKSRDSSDLGIVLLELFAYMGDIMSFYIDRAANEAFLATATQRDSVLSIAEILGYTPNQANPAGVSLTFTNTHDSKSIVIPPRLQVSTATINSSSITPVIFETFNTENVTLTAGQSTSLLAYEGYTVSDEILTAAFSGYPSQEFQLLEPGAHVKSIEVYVGEVRYTQVTNLLQHDGTDSVYTTRVDAEGNTFIKFGDNVGGRIPQLNSEISATYRVISGSAGNVISGTINYVLSPYNFSDQTEGAGLTVANATSASGGSDVETTSSIRYNAPLSLKAVNRAVTLYDYASLAVQVGGVSKVAADADVYSSINIYMGLDGSPGLDGLGNPTEIWEEVANDVSQYLLPKTPPGVSVTVLPPTMVPINVGINIFVSPEYKQESIARDVSNAVNEMFSYQEVEFGKRVTVQEISGLMARIPGVQYSQIVQLYGHAATSGLADVVCLNYEIPYLDTLDIVATGGII